MTASRHTSFPPLLDLRAAGWSEARMATAASVAAVNNAAVDQATSSRLELTDHIYGFGHICDALAERPADE